MTIGPQARDEPNANRRVASLTAQQVEKKRAIDRENQRHCRAKTKNRIRALEEKVAELTGQLRAAEAQIAYYQHREQTRGSDTSSSNASDPPTITGFPGTVLGERNSTWPGKEVAPRPATSTYDSLGTYSGSDPMSPRLFNFPLDFGAGITLNAFSDSREEIGISDLDFIGTIDFSAPSVPIFPEIPPTSMDQWATPSDAKQDSDLQPWQRVPIHIAPTAKLEHVIVETMTAWRARALECGHQDAELSEPVFPSISSLLNPITSSDGENGNTNTDSNLPHPMASRTSRPLSNVAAAQTYRTPLKTLPERLGFMFILSHLLRWLVCRTKESYEAMPEFLRPTELQLTVPHPAWIDIVIRPEVRDAMITHMDWGRFEELRKLTGDSLSVNWPLSGAAAVVEAPDKQSLMLSPEFEAHVRRRENWSMGTEATEIFPFLKRFSNHFRT